MKFLIPASFDNWANRKDKSVTLRFITQEVTPNQVLEFQTMLDNYGYLCFKSEEQLTSDELKQIDEMETEISGKSLSKRYMNALYVYWYQNKSGYKEFKDFYKHTMETMIQKVKDKLI